MKKRPLITLFFALLLSMIFISCGDDCDNGIKAEFGSIDFSHISLEEMPEAVTTFRVTGLGDDDHFLYGPVTLERRQLHTLCDVPVGLESLLIEYLEGETLLSSSRIPVSINAGTVSTISVWGDPLAPVHLASAPAGWHLLVENEQDPLEVADPRPAEPTEITDISQKMSMFVKGVGNNYQGTVDYKPYTTEWYDYVNPDIKELGANTIRMYGLPYHNVPSWQDIDAQIGWLETMLAAADAMSSTRNKIYVIPGIYALGKDDSTTADDVKKIASEIQNDQNFDHVLLWNVGFEVDPSLLGKNGYIDTLLGAVKEAQGTDSKNKRPVMHSTWSISGTDSKRVALFNDMENLDILGVDSYYGTFGSAVPPDPGLSTEASELKSAGLKKPFLFAEWLTYDWAIDNEVAGFNIMLNPGGDYYMFEENSTGRAQQILNNWQKYIDNNTIRQDGCLGGIALNWGPPHQTGFISGWVQAFYAYKGDYRFSDQYNPERWTGSPPFTRFEGAKSLSKAYGGSLAGVSCPEIVLGADNDPQGISCTFKATPGDSGAGVSPGEEVTANVVAKGTPDMTFAWYIVGGKFSGQTDEASAIIQPNQSPQRYSLPATSRIRADGPVAGSHTETVTSQGTKSIVSFKMPSNTPLTNNYQLRMIVTGENNWGATAAIGFRMK